jgi:hypothetical protein
LRPEPSDVRDVPKTLDGGEGLGLASRYLQRQGKKGEATKRTLPARQSCS